VAKKSHTATHKDEMITVCLVTMVSTNPWKQSVFEKWFLG